MLLSALRRGAIAVAVVFALVVPAAAAQPPFILVSTESGIGSGFHVGGGVYLTAAHVVSSGGPLSLVAEDGTAKPARIVKIFLETDVAVLSAAPWVEVVPVSCDSPARGAPVTLHGSPMGHTFLQLYGHVAGEARAAGGRPSLVPLDLTVLQGVSGGAVTGETGEVVAMAVSIESAATAPRGYFTVTGLGWAVPGDVLCEAIESGKAAIPSKTAK